MDSSSWSAPDHSHHQALHTAADDDFHQFLDINDIGALDFDFHDFAADHHTAHHAGHHAADHLLHSSGGEQLDTPMTGTDMSMILSPVDHAMLQHAQQQHQHQQHQMPTITTTAPYQNAPTALIQPSTPSDAIVNTIDAQIQFLQQQKLHAQHQQLQEQQAAFFANQQNHIVPPTPQSLELTAGSSQNYYAQSTLSDQHHSGRQQQQQPQQQPQQAIDYRYTRIKDQHDMSFTPLVSPAVTPLETHFPIDTPFAVPGAYFSPLTSPALHAQNDALGIIDQRLGMMSGSSPREMELEPPAMSQASVSPGDLARKTRKNAVKARAKSSGGIKQSPISKPIRRKTATTPMLNPQALNQLIENAVPSQERQQPPTPLLQTSSSSTAGVTDSENGSVSPHNLNDVVSPVEMPPPPLPKPRSAKPSPFLAPQASSSAVPITLQPGRPGIASPATPASLMKLSSPSNRNPEPTGTASHDPMDADHIETFELPDSINWSSAPKPAPIITTLGTPALDPIQKAAAPLQSPSLPPPPSPVVTKPLALPSAALSSPQLKPDSANSHKRTPQLAPMGRYSKKRGSVASVQISPALRPKMSPSIKPLLPGGSTGAEEAASLLLATKSNYQRILEGSTVPGVSYPSELSTNLTSKRTSHKIAEQGRRNRINSALQEIATLLPKVPGKEGRDGDGDGNSSSGGGGGSGGADKEDKREKDKDKAGGGIPNSKASTVEMAIEYIKQLQKEVAEANKRAEEAERKLGEMKMQGGTATGLGSPGGDAGDATTEANPVMDGDLKAGGGDAMDE
ncbi:phosphorus acquisition controlling protein [Neurospora tetraspora]|uniref:Phosphorus acquisition controlling protein n=1 Tax=Neurospora tetraspora TaxID=94610 RepID=A0AAE0J188_9PEZI|nr:phosphorus acquisition controlling protein [Neurospora tetraspora]